MSNRVEELLKINKTNAHAFAKKIGVAPSVIYSIVSDNQNFEKIGIGTFIKIAHGFGMTADELYDVAYREDYELSQIKRIYENTSDEGRRFLYNSALTVENMYPHKTDGGNGDNSVSVAS